MSELLKDRQPLSDELIADVASRSSGYGVELRRVGVKDIAPPGAVHGLFLQEVEADLKGRARLVAARHEVAAARARANTAKLLQENPNLLRLQELELISSLASKSGNVVVIYGLDRLLTKAVSTAPPNGQSNSSIRSQGLRELRWVTDPSPTGFRSSVESCPSSFGYDIQATKGWRLQCAADHPELTGEAIHGRRLRPARSIRQRWRKLQVWWRPKTDKERAKLIGVRGFIRMLRKSH